MAKTCGVCGKKIGFLEGKVTLLDGVMCEACWRIGGLGDTAQAAFDAMHRTVDEMRRIRGAIDGTGPKDIELAPIPRPTESKKKMTWEIYYRDFLSWTWKEREANLELLQHFGGVDEVFELCISASSKERFVNKLVEKAFRTGVRFSPQQVMALLPLLKQPLRNQVVEFASDRYTKDQLRQLEHKIEDGVLYRILERHGTKFTEPVSGTAESAEFYEPHVGDAVPASVPEKKKAHDGRCDGDCENCPPHYGYRHGRWYYGHDHVEGCEFGGNKGGCTGKTEKWR